jgi:hypothetical protein
MPRRLGTGAGALSLCAFGSRSPCCRESGGGIAAEALVSLVKLSSSCFTQALVRGRSRDSTFYEPLVLSLGLTMDLPSVTGAPGHSVSPQLLRSAFSPAFDVFAAWAIEDM